MGFSFKRVPQDNSHVVLHMNTVMDGPELPLPSHTHKRKCSWKTGFLLSGTVFVFCLLLQPASGTMDIFGEGNKQRVSAPKASPGTAQPQPWAAEPQSSS